MTTNPLTFIEAADIGAHQLLARAEGVEDLNLDQLPKGVVSGNTLIDFSDAVTPVTRSGVSLSMLFAERVATAAMRDGDDEDDWFAAYKTNLGKLGFAVSGGAVSVSRFRKKGLFVHQAIIPFLTIALGGAGVGPIIMAALKNLSEMDKDKPWITLFDQQSRKMNTREMHFAVVQSDAITTSIRHVMARLDFAATETSVLFFRINSVKAEFESATTTMTIDNALLAVNEAKLRARLEADAGDFIAGGVI